MFDLTQVKEDWLPVLLPMTETPAWKNLEAFVSEERERYSIYPDHVDVFRAFRETALSDVKVVIVGQDPYHNEGQAQGLSFSVPAGVRKPPSLQNIFKELNEDLGIGIPKSGDLTSWAQQGVFLLNTVLTVRAHAPGSHRKHGWESVTDAVLRAVSATSTPKAFVLWGKHAQDKRTHIVGAHHRIIESAHPSPLSAYNGFFGSRPFSKVNNFLYDHSVAPVDWQLPNA